MDLPRLCISQHALERYQLRFDKNADHDKLRAAVLFADPMSHNEVAWFKPYSGDLYLVDRSKTIVFVLKHTQHSNNYVLVTVLAWEGAFYGYRHRGRPKHFPKPYTRQRLRSSQLAVAEHDD